MKRLLAVTLLIPAVALAASYGGAAGQNKRGEWVYIEGDMAEYIRVRKGDVGTAVLAEYSLAEECPSFENRLDENRFHCRSSGKSPLAGATYKITTKEDYMPCNVAPNYYKDPGEVYICIAGCENDRVPAMFYVAPSECV